MAGKRDGKSQKHSESEVMCDGESAKHLSGMSAAWQEFYEQVRRSVAESVPEMMGNSKSDC